MNLVNFVSSRLQVHPLNRYFIPPKKNNGVESFFLRAAETNISLVSRVFLVREWKTTMACFSCFHRDKLQWKSLFSKVIKAPVFGNLILVLKEMTVLSLHFACCNHMVNIVKERVNFHFFLFSVNILYSVAFDEAKGILRNTWLKYCLLRSMLAA